MLVVLRSTTACNLHCGYCSAACGEAARQDLSEDDCRLLLQQLPTVLRDEETVSFLWHGGEPTLLAPARFAAMQGILSGIAQHGHPVHCLMQTNGYCLSGDWLETLRQFDVGVGVSVDGPVFLHDAMRSTSSGCGSYVRVMQNVEAMRHREIAVSLLCTVHNGHLGNEACIAEWLKEQDVSIRFNPLLRLGRSPYALTSEAYFNFLRNVFIQAMKLGICHSIEPLRWMLTSILTDTPPTECSYSGECGESIISYGPGGVVGACNRTDESFGSLKEAPLSVLREGNLWRNRRQRVKRLKSHCSDCSIWTFCHGGCPEAEGEKPNPSRCESRRAFFAWLRGEGLDVYHKVLLHRQGYLREHLRQLRQVKELLSRRNCPIESSTHTE